MFIYILPPKKYIYIPSRNKQSVPPPPVRPSTKNALRAALAPHRGNVYINSPFPTLPEPSLTAGFSLCSRRNGSDRPVHGLRWSRWRWRGLRRFWCWSWSWCRWCRWRYRLRRRWRRRSVHLHTQTWNNGRDRRRQGGQKKNPG